MNCCCYWMLAIILSLSLLQSFTSFRSQSWRITKIQSKHHLHHYDEHQQQLQLKASRVYDLSTYIQDQLLPLKQTTNYQIYSSFDPFLSATETAVTSDDHFRDSIICIDYHIRNSTDFLSALLSYQQTSFYGKIQRFLKKFQSSQESFATDRLFTTYDVGIDTLEKISLIRIPPDIFQKQEIARKLAETHRKTATTAVIMLTLHEVMIDVDMAESIFSAFQLSRFQMPSLKGLPRSPRLESSVSQTKNKQHEASDGLSMEEIAKSYLNLEEQRSEGEEGQTKKDLPAKLLEFIDPSFKKDENKETSDTEQASEGKSLEEIMLEEARKRFGGTAEINNKKRRDTYPQPSLKQLKLNDRLEQAIAINHGTNLARALTTLPPNFLTPTNYVNILQDIAHYYQWEINIYSSQQLREIGCGAFAAVTEGNPPSSDYLVYLRYYRAESTEESNQYETVNYRAPNEFLELNPKKPVVLIGKGVCYDTGGISLKPTRAMRTMKVDMAGSSVALGTFLSLFLQNQEKQIDHAECWLPIVENNIGPQSYRPDDIVRSLSGETIEIMDTDAEGRLILADTLTLASRKVEVRDVNTNPPAACTFPKVEPAIMIDFATLTGTSITSLTNRYISLFSNREHFTPLLIQAGKLSGEKAWPFPLDQDLLEDLKTSTIADLLQCRAGSEADHIYAALFLQQFIKSGTPWIHCDLGSAHRPGGLGLIGSEYTGAGVRLAHQLLQQLFSLSSER